MTMYYVDLNPLDVEKMVTVAHEKAMINASDECLTFIKSNFDKPDNLLSHVFNNSGNCLMAINEKSLLSDVGTGLCTVGCEGCNIGYEKITGVGNTLKTDFTPVPGGKESCELCRYFISYPSYLDKLKIR
jgi:hypothetical protein